MVYFVAYLFEQIDTPTRCFFLKIVTYSIVKIRAQLLRTPLPFLPLTLGSSLTSSKPVDY